MHVAFTARKGKITKALQTQAEDGMERIGRILGRTARASATFSAQRHLHIVELAIMSRAQNFAATGKGDSPDAALREAIEHAEHQVHRHRDRRIVSKRLPKGEKVMTAPPVTRPKRVWNPWPMAERPRRPVAKRARPSRCTRFLRAPRWSSRTSSETAKPFRCGR